jgi:hypothetical protein
MYSIFDTGNRVALLKAKQSGWNIEITAWAYVSENVTATGFEANRFLQKELYVLSDLELYNTEVYQLIKLGTHYNSNQ